MMRLSCLVLAGLAVFTDVALAQEPVVVIANPAAPVQTIDTAQATQIFLKRVRNWPDGTAIEPIDIKEGSPLRDAFYKQVTGRGPAQLRAYWARQAFTGMGFPPRQADSAEAASRMVQDEPGAISYTAKSSVSGDVKVVLEANP